MSRRQKLIFFVVIALATGGATGALAAFFGSTDNAGSSFSAKRVSSAQRSLTPWVISDAADGSASNGSDNLALEDGVFHMTGLISATWSTARYIEVDFAADAPAGLPATEVELLVDYADGAGGGAEVSCFWIELRRQSTGAVIGSRGSSSSPVSCESTQTVRSTATSILNEVADGTVANDLRVRLYVQNAGGNDEMLVDRVAVAFKRYGKTWTLNPTRRVDAADGTPATSTWGPTTAGDGAVYRTAGSWATSFSGTRYVDFTVPSNVPGGATVSGAQLRHAYKATTAGSTACWYAAVYSGATLLATYGSSGSPAGCNSTTAYQTDTLALPAVDTAAELSGLRVRIYSRTSVASTTEHDLVAVDATWSVPATGCVDAGAVTLTPVADTYTDENAPTATNLGTATTAFVMTRNGQRNRRAYFRFSLPSTPDGCTLTAATLRLNFTSIAAGRTLETYRAGSAWIETGTGVLNWNNQPTFQGTAATLLTTSGAGVRTIDVLGHVQTMYAGANEGFVVKDSVEGGAGIQQAIATREHASPSTLVVTFG